MKWKLTLVIVAASFFGFSQSQNPCALDTSQLLYLMWQLEVTDSGRFEKYHIAYVSQNQNAEFQQCDSYFDVKHDKSTGNFYANMSVFDPITGSYGDPDFYLINLEKISQLSMDIYYNSDEEAGKKPFDFSTVELLKYINLQRLQSLAIHQGSNLYEFPFIINLASWPGYKLWGENNALTELNISSVDVGLDKKLFADIRPFKKLKRLYVGEYMNGELLNYPELENVSTTDALGFFAHHLFELPALKRFSSNVSYVGCFWHDPSCTYATESFFIDALPISSPTHPLHAMDSVIRTKAKAHVGPEFMPLLFSDWNMRGYRKKDTLAIGAIMDGKPAGVWRFEIFHEHTRGWKTYHYDYDQQKPFRFPTSGLWEYHFQNGQLAISGRFAEGKKEGLWKFYDPNGDLASLRNFKKDEIREPAINYPTADGGGTVYNSSLMQRDFSPTFKIGRRSYGFNKNGNLERIKDGLVVKTIPVGSAKFCRLVGRLI